MASAYWPATPQEGAAYMLILSSIFGAASPTNSQANNPLCVVHGREAVPFLTTSVRAYDSSALVSSM